MFFSSFPAAGFLVFWAPPNNHDSAGIPFGESATFFYGVLMWGFKCFINLHTTAKQDVLWTRIFIVCIHTQNEIIIFITKCDFFLMFSAIVPDKPFRNTHPFSRRNILIFSAAKPWYQRLQGDQFGWLGICVSLSNPLARYFDFFSLCFLSEKSRISVVITKAVLPEWTWASSWLYISGVPDSLWSKIAPLPSGRRITSFKKGAFSGLLPGLLVASRSTYFLNCTRCLNAGG